MIEVEARPTSQTLGPTWRSDLSDDALAYALATEMCRLEPGHTLRIAVEIFRRMGQRNNEHFVPPFFHTRHWNAAKDEFIVRRLETEE